MTKKTSPIHRRDSVSGDSLSFAGLVCMQDVCVVQSHSNIPSSKKETEFEFDHHVTHNITTVDQNSNNCPADILFYKGQLLPQAIQLPQQNQALKQSDSEKDFPTVRNNNKKATAGESFGQKILRLASPCRDCHATATIPSTKPQASG
ncbi:hypothetical protein RDI58_005179 [Solanum bulbocastanum]|uniref:Uncharacterized protein n=1 Tax=Solanum bulbocastanum TaxID=147425 RepID=A0AAN8U7Y8_SOLBU